MGNLLKEILELPESETGHIDDEDLARLAEGKVEPEERRIFNDHLAACGRCYEIYKGVVLDLTSQASKSHDRGFGKKIRLFAIAASLLFCIGVGAYYYQARLHPAVYTAQLEVDGQLKELLMQNENQEWGDKGRIDRLTAVLEHHGFKKFKEKPKVVMVAAYTPTKSLMNEVLVVRYEKGVLFLEVKTEAELRKEK